MNRLSALAVVALAAFAQAQDRVSPSKAFEDLKGLVGTWEGKAGEGGAAMTVKVVYRLTGAGSALVETQFPGTAHEMVTVYHMDGDKLMLTHYCAAGNQPRMRLVSVKGSTYAFDFAGGTNVKESDMHMHSLKITLLGKDHVTSEWTSMMGGKPGMVAKFDLHRSSPIQKG